MPIRVRGGHVYDPEKARVIGSYFRGAEFDPEGGEVPGDGLWERLQRTKAGRYFVYGVGGRDSRYAQVGRDGRWEAGSAVTPLSRDDAEAWARRHLEVAAWRAEFGEPSPDATRSLTVRVPERVYRAIRDEASELGVSMGDVVSSRFPEQEGR